MKLIPSVATMIATLAIAQTTSLANKTLKEDPAYLPIDEVVDLSVLKPEVNVNLPKFLIKNAISEIGTGKDSPLVKAGIDIESLVKDVKLIRVVVIDADDEQRDQVDRAATALRSELDKSWMQIVSVPEEQVGIYALSDADGERMIGLALVVQDGNSLVIGNIVGELPLGKLLAVAAKLRGGDLEELLPPDLLEEIGGILNQEEQVIVHESSESGEDEEGEN